MSQPTHKPLHWACYFHQGGKLCPPLFLSSALPVKILTIKVIFLYYFEFYKFECDFKNILIPLWMTRAITDPVVMPRKIYIEIRQLVTQVLLKITGATQQCASVWESSSTSPSVYLLNTDTKCNIY